jgi:hypothetical protein
MLLQVPGGQSTSHPDKFDGPSGVIVCCEDLLIYKHQNAKEHRVPIPKRDSPFSDPAQGVIIVAAVMHKMRVRLLFFFFFFFFFWKSRLIDLIFCDEKSRGRSSSSFNPRKAIYSK